MSFLVSPLRSGHIQTYQFCLFTCVLFAVKRFLCAQVSSIIHCGSGEEGKKMFYACLNMHLKSKSIRNDSENAKGFHHCLLIHDAPRKATYFRANPCYHWRGSPHRSHFPPEDMRFNDSFRWCRWNRDTDSMFTMHAISKQWGRGELYIKLRLYDEVFVSILSFF